MALSKTPTILIHSHEESRPIANFYTYAVNESRGVTSVNYPRLLRPPQRWRDAYFSTAPLDNITQIEVFYDKSNGFCGGLLLDYENGAQRALGQCRLGIDATTISVSPSRLCWLSTSHPPSEGLESRWATKVEISGTAKEHRHNDDGWHCSDLKKKTINFWFSNLRNAEETYIQLVDENLDT